MRSKLLYKVAVVFSCIVLVILIWTRTWFLTVLITCSLILTVSQESITNKKALRIIRIVIIAVIYGIRSNEIKKNVVFSFANYVLNCVISTVSDI